MDCVDLLAREEEFRKLNKQIEKKTESLMKEIENKFIDKDDFFNFSPSPHASYTQTKSHSCSGTSSMSNSNDNTPKKSYNKKTKSTLKPTKEQSDLTENLNSVSTDCCNCCAGTETKNEDLEFLQAFVSLHIQLKVLPDSFSKGDVNVEKVCKFMASKVQLMQEQMDRFQTTLDRKVSQCNNHMKQLAEYESEKLRTLNKCSNMATQWTSMKNKLTATQNKLNEKEKQYIEQRSECDKLKSELNKVNATNVKLEAKGITHSAEIERLQQTIDRMKVIEKDARDRSRAVTSSHAAAILRLEAAAARHLGTIDKQRRLIDNLRRQASALSAAAALGSLDREFVQFLLKS